MLFLSKIKSLQSRSKNVIYNSILSVIYKLISILLSFVSTPLLLECLGQEKYGIWASILSIISWIYYLDMGIGSGVRNQLASTVALNNFYVARNVLCLGFFLTSVISIIFLLFVSVLLFFIDLQSFLGINLPDENTNIIFYFAFLFACVNFVGALVNNVYYALQKSSIVSLFNLLGQLFFVIALLFFLFTENKLLLYISLAEGGAQFLKNILANAYAFLKNKNLRFSLVNLKFSYTKYIMTFGLQMFIMQIAALVLNCTDNLIISKFFGPSEVTPYDICYKCFALVNSFFVILLTPILSAYTEANAKNDYKWINKTLTNCIYLYLIFLLIIIFFGFIFKNCVNFWLRQNLNYETSLIIYIVLYFSLLMISHVYSTFLAGIGKIARATLIMIFQAVINIPISIILSTYFKFGVNGVILGSICSMLISSIFFPIMVYNILHKFSLKEKIIMMDKSS